MQQAFSEIVNAMTTILAARFVLNDIPHILSDSSSSSREEINKLIPRYLGGPPVPKLVYEVGVPKKLSLVPFPSRPMMTEIQYADSYIRWAVLAVGVLEGVETTSSCQGHPEKSIRENIAVAYSYSTGAITERVLTSMVNEAIRNKALGVDLSGYETAYVTFRIDVGLASKVEVIAEAKFGRPQTHQIHGRPVYNKIEGDYHSAISVSEWSKSDQTKGGYVAVMYIPSIKRPSFLEWHTNKDRYMAELIKVLYSAAGEHYEEEKGE